MKTEEQAILKRESECSKSISHLFSNLASKQSSDFHLQFFTAINSIHCLINEGKKMDAAA